MHLDGALSPTCISPATVSPPSRRDAEEGKRLCSAFLRVMGTISSAEAEVSSREAACCAAPWESEPLAPET